jgi:hypothetical protein
VKNERLLEDFKWWTAERSSEATPMLQIGRWLVEDVKSL